MDRTPVGWGSPLSSGGILFDSILILPSLSILPFPRSYRFGIYHNPTYPIYRIISSSICRIAQWTIQILPALCILPCLRSYRIGVYHNPTYSIYRLLSYLRPPSGASYGLDNHLAAWELALEPKDKRTLYDIPPSWYPAVSASVGSQARAAWWVSDP